MALVSGKLFVDFAAPDAYRRTGKFDIWIMAGMMLLTVYADIQHIFQGRKDCIRCCGNCNSCGMFFCIEKETGKDDDLFGFEKDTIMEILRGSSDYCNYRFTDHEGA